MNTRLQVEHGVTELCYDVDLVELMLRQADARLQGRGGIDADVLHKMQPSSLKGAAIEARVYAENPAKDYTPSPGTLQFVEWGSDIEGFRIDTWVHTGSIVSSFYDPLLAKIMVHSEGRNESVSKMATALAKLRVCGPPTNLDFLKSITENSTFKEGNTMTKFLDDFRYEPAAVGVVSGGAYTIIQDYPGRPSMGRGFPHAGPMDPVAFQVANALVGNPLGLEGLECTLDGPELRFYCPALVAICGAAMEIQLDEQRVDMWSAIHINAGQRLKIGRMTGEGCRSYVAIRGGLPSVAEWFGSKATSPGVGVGGYQGRALASGDLLELNRDVPEDLSKMLKLPRDLIPQYSNQWALHVMVGPYQEGYLTDTDIGMIHNTEWEVSHNAARGGIRLNGPKPKFARQDGGEGGAHPSNVAEYGYPVGTLNWTGDDPCIFPVDCPDFGGFISSTTIIKADWWKMGQMKAGNTLNYVQVTYDDAVEKRKRVQSFVDEIATACAGSGDFSNAEPLENESKVGFSNLSEAQAVIHSIAAKGTQPLVSYRQGGDCYLLVDYGDGSFDLNHRCRVTALNKHLKKSKGPISFSSGLINTVGCCNSLLIYFDSLKIPRSRLIAYLIDLEAKIGDLSETKVPSRIFRLPILFDSKKQKEATKRYMETQRPYASYLPDNMDFVAKNNGMKRKDLMDIYLNAKLIAVRLVFPCPGLHSSFICFLPPSQVQSWPG